MNEILNAKDGTKIHYQKVSGKNPGVVFLGGFMSDMTGTKALYLESKCREWGHAYVRFDYYGHGLSDGDFKTGTIGRWLEDSLCVLDQLTEGPQILVGSSMGGWLMILAALQRTERIKGLVGIAAAPDFIEDFARLSEEQYKSLETKGVCYIPSQYGEKPYPISQQLIEEGKHHKVLGSSIHLDCPVRLLHGLNDTDVSWQKSLQLTEKLNSNDVRLTLIKEGDHRLSSDQQLELLGNTVKGLF